MAKIKNYAEEDTVFYSAVYAESSQLSNGDMHSGDAARKANHTDRRYRLCNS